MIIKKLFANRKEFLNVGKCCFVVREREDRASLAFKLNQNKKPLFSGVMALGMLWNGYYFISGMLSFYSAFTLYTSSNKVSKKVHNFVDEKMTSIHNNKVLYAVE